MTTRKILLILTTLSLLVMAIGCSNNNVEPELTVDEPNFTDEFGGYTVANESPGFNNDELLTAAYESDEEYEDPVLASPEAETLIRDPEAGHYHIRILWGQLRFDPSHTSPTDWSGSLSITRGAEIIRRVIRFERGQDEIVARTDRTLIEWISRTTVHNDGIAVDLFIPRVRPILDTLKIEETDSLGNTTVIINVDTTWPDVEPVMVEFSTGPYSETFSLEDLVSLDKIVYLDDSNAVAFHAFKLDRFPCPRGFLAGAWGFDADGNGVFRGVWTNRRGYVVGYLKGHFGRTDSGAQIFFGKWVSREGRFEGFIRGRWGFNCSDLDVNSTANAGGWFSGAIYTSNREQIGRLAGKFRSGSLANDARGGFFQGRWKVRCNDESDSETDLDDGMDDL